MHGTEVSVLLASPGTHATTLDLELSIGAMLLPGLQAYRRAAWLSLCRKQIRFPNSDCIP